MNDWKTIALLAKRSLVILAVALGLGLALYVGSHYYKERMRSELGQTEQLYSASQASLLEKQTNLDKLQTEINRFLELRQQGMVGAADREGWIEQLLASHTRTGLPPTLRYTLHPPKPLDTSGEPVAGAQADPGGAPSALVHDLDIALSNIHEEELLALLREYKTHVKGRFRLNACILTDRSATGLSARCTLRFFTLAEAAQASAPN